MNFSQLPRESASAQVPTSRRDGFYNRKIDVKTQEMVNLARGVTARLEEGNFKGAVRLITSSDKPTPTTQETLRILLEKHPPAPVNRRPSPPVTSPSPQLAFEESAVRKAILSFPAGFSGGTDSLTPQHLKDMIFSEGSSSRDLLSAITSLVNLVANGNVPSSVQPTFFGDRLIVLTKKDGGIRPIVVGLVFRRLVSKL